MISVMTTCPARIPRTHESGSDGLLNLAATEEAAVHCEDPNREPNFRIYGG